MSDLSEAHERLERAIKDVDQAAGGAPGLLVDYVIITAWHNADDDGGSSTAIGMSFAHDATGGMPDYRVKGMLQEAVDIMRNRHDEEG